MTYTRTTWATDDTVTEDEANNWEQGIVDQMLRTPMRQAILSGAVSATGTPAFLQIGTGLAVDLLATTTPLVLSFGNGGRPDTATGDPTAVIAADVTSAWSSLTNNTTCYLYVDLAAGVITYGFETTAPKVQAYAPSAPATGQHWFDTSTWTMKRWSGAAWVTFTRIFVGHCVTSGGAVTVVEPASIGAFIAAGIIVAPNQTFIEASGSVVIGSFGGTARVTSMTVASDPSGEFDTTNACIRIKTAGQFMMLVGIYSVPPNLIVNKNGVSISLGNVIETTSSSNVYLLRIALAAGDKLEFYGNNNVSGTATLPITVTLWRVN